MIDLGDDAARHQLIEIFFSLVSPPLLHARESTWKHQPQRANIYWLIGRHTKAGPHTPSSLCKGKLQPATQQQFISLSHKKTHDQPFSSFFWKKKREFRDFIFPSALAAQCVSDCVCLGFSIGLVNLPLPFCPPQTRDGLDCVNINDSTTQSNRVHSSGRRRTARKKKLKKKRNPGEVKNFPSTRLGSKAREFTTQWWTGGHFFLFSSYCKGSGQQSKWI